MFSKQYRYEKNSFLFRFVVDNSWHFASSRSYSEKLPIAKMVLQDLPSSATRSSFSELQILQENQALSVIGYSQCGYVVIANDNRFNAVIGYSAKAFQENNPGLNGG